ncbi:MAG: HAD family hydrolase [Lachnospiraceae bacterium]|nr:HAD family hydrolase [Lachnospiraceae bacterium]
MSIKLIAFDLDGTFLDDDKNCPKENLEAICAAAERGVIIVPSSGRMFDGIPEPIRNLPFVRYAITINGAGVFDREEDREIYRATIPFEDAERIYDYVETLPCSYDCYLENRGYIDRYFYDHLEDFIEDDVIRHMNWKLRGPVDNFRQYMQERHASPQKIQLMFKDLERKKYELEHFDERFPGCVATSSLPPNIEINAEAANKGAGLKALCEYLGIDLSETMALGDGGNDITMLQMAGLGVAMGNAEETVKAVADVVVGTNEEAGVAEAIRRYVL